MKKMISSALLFCVGFTACSMQPRLPKYDKKNFGIMQKKEQERFIAQKKRAQKKEESLKRSQERDRKYQPQDEGQ